LEGRALPAATAKAEARETSAAAIAAIADAERPVDDAQLSRADDR
jgi:hypothetical protein